MRIIHFQLLARVGWIVPVVLVLTLAACGVTTGEQQPGGATSSTPTATAASTTTPGGTPVPTVPPAGAIALSTDRASYTTSGNINIIVTLINGRATSIFAFDHQTSCTILRLQRQTASGWQAVGGCAQGRMTVQVEIKAGAKMKITLAPTAGQMHPTPWPAGTYRVALNYSLQKQEMATGATATSPTFAIS